jgi:CRISPR-associated protein (TIGR02584 family)
MQQAETSCMPTEVHIITTQRGKPYVEQLICDSTDAGWLKKLCDDYRLPMPLCDSSHIHCITDHQGTVLSDIRTRDDNTYAADYITKTVQELTADDNSSLIVSLSGGRRTMTFYVGYALSLFGRPQDRLTHVLVEDEYFFNTEFFYPTPEPLWVVRDDNTGFDASKVEVTLADIPFVRLREGLPSRLLNGQTSFSDTVDAAQAEFAPAKVVFEAQTGDLRCGNKRVEMNTVELSFYVLMLTRCQREEGPVRWTDAALDKEFLEIYTQLRVGATGGTERIRKALINGMTKEYFEQRKSRVNRALRLALGKRVAQIYCIDSHGKRPNTRFGVSLPASAILLV